MSIAETYLLASKARSKLTKEASKQDHDLRVLVGHANLLDNLMDSIHDYKFAPKQQVVEPVSILDSKKFTSSRLQHVSTVSFVDDDSDSDEDWESAYDEEEDDEIIEEDSQYGSRVSYSITDSDSEDDSEDDTEDDEEEDEDLAADEDDEDPWKVRFSLPTKNDTSSNFRQLPTIDELTEHELQSMEAESESEPESESVSESESESEDELQEEIEEADIVDIIHLNQPPQLSYSTTDESDSESEIEEEEAEHQPQKRHQQNIKDSELIIHKHSEEEEAFSGTITRATLCS